MPRVNKVERARKAIPHAGIAVGDTYYWWTFKNQRGPGTKVVSKTYPRPSQLTRSSFKSQWRSFSEQMGDLSLDDGLYDALVEIAGEIRSLGEECQGSLDNMPEGLQQGATGEMLQERIQNCETWADEIEGLDQPELEEPEEPDFEDVAPDQDDFVADINREGCYVTEADAYDAFFDAATAAWEQHVTEIADAKEQAESDYEAALEELRDAAVNADPGEV
jgi:hypothetical protein